MRKRVRRVPEAVRSARRAWTVCGLLLLVCLSAWAEERPARRPGEIPWRQDRASRKLTKPQSSRLLPPADDAATTAEDESEEREAAERPSDDNSPRTARLPKRGESSGPSRHDDEPVNDLPSETEATRDGRWWQEEAEATVSNPENGVQGRSVSPRGEIIQSTQILAMVGNEPILAGDLLGRINEILEPYKSQATEEQLEQQRWVLMEKLLPAAMESKLVYLDFTRELDKDKIKSIRSNVYQQFDEKQLPRLLEQAKVESSAELEERFRSLGTSLENTRRAFFEQVAAREMVKRETDDESEVTHDQLLNYYQEHADEYQVQARAKWEQLTARFDRFSSKQEAETAIVEMGNSVLNGARFDEVAKRQSQGPTAKDGGKYDWTVRGSLVSTVLDEAIFSLPLNEMSEIIEDETGLHIIRVTEREDEGKVPFIKAQKEIREKIKELRQDEMVKAYVERLKRETYVWNYFEENAKTAERDRRKQQR